jgi:hypothetical protein
MTAPTHGVKILAMAAIVVSGLIHLRMAGDAFGNTRYEGLLFVANGIGALVAAVGVYRDRTPGRGTEVVLRVPYVVRHEPAASGQASGFS